MGVAFTKLRSCYKSCAVLYVVLSCSVVSDSVTPWTAAFQAPLTMEDSPGESTRVACHALLQGIFPTQGSNPGLPHCRWNLYGLSRQGTLHWFPVVPYLGLNGFFPVWLYLRLKLHTDLSSVSWAWRVLSYSLLPSGLCTISSICIGFLPGTSHWFFLISGLSSDVTSPESPSSNCHIKSTLL